MQPSGVPSVPRFVLVTDLDHTLYDPDDVDHLKLLRFNGVWRRHCAKDCLLVYSTGRSLAKFQQLKAKAPLLEPDLLICSVGTELYRDGKLDNTYEQRLDQGWDRSALHKAAMAVVAQCCGLTEQPDTEQRPHKISLEVAPGVDADAVVARLKDALSATNKPHSIIYSAGKDVDILPRSASKGAAVKVLLQETLGIQGAERILVAGDSGNDIDMLAVDGVRACIVSNAKPELLRWVEDNRCSRVYQAQAPCAGGILDAMVHFGFLLQGDAW